MSDGGGLCLLVSSAGGKVWRSRCRFAGKEKMMAFGEYPMVSIKEARERHFEARKVLAACVDPMAERRAETEAKLSEIRAAQREPEMSIVKIAGAWWEWWAVGKSPRHADTVIRRLKADVFPALGHKFIEQLRLPTFGK